MAAEISTLKIDSRVAKMVEGRKNGKSPETVCQNGVRDEARRGREERWDG